METNPPSNSDMPTTPLTPPASPHQDLVGHPVRRRKTAKIIAGIVVGLVVIFYLGPLTLQSIKNYTARGKVAKAFTAAESSSDAAFEAKVQLVKRLGLVKTEIASSKVNICYVTHSDGGWFAVSWHQDCYIRHVKGFITYEGKNSVASRVGSSTEGLKMFGEVSTIGCELFEKEYKTTMIYRPAHVSTSDLHCGVPGQLQGLLSVRGPILLDNELAVKRYEHFDENSISNISGQIWLVQDDVYYEEELGCGVGGILCSSPRSKPATDF